MSRQLPPNASLEHLKKQAKVLLRMLQAGDPAARLADAQHAVAQQYGFPNWPKLKAHVEALPGEETLQTETKGTRGGGADGKSAAVAEAPDFAFDRYTMKAKQAVFFSRFEAARAGSMKIEPEHVLLGIIGAASNTSARLAGRFLQANVTIDEARRVASSGRVGEQLPVSAHIPFSAEARIVLGYAAREAAALRHSNLDLIHLLLGILRGGEGESLAARILTERGITLEQSRGDAAILFEPDGEARR